MLDKRIAEASDHLCKAQNALKRTLARVQSKCKHETVVETPWESSNWGTPFNARRICLKCRFEEEGSHWSGGKVWSRVDSGLTTLGNAPKRMVTEINRNDFYQLRVR